MTKQSKANRASVVILVIIVVCILVGNIWAEETRLSRLSITTESFITADGIVYDLHEDSEDNRKNTWLRKISPEGRLLRQIPLQKSANQGEVYRNIVDVLDGEVYLFEYKYETEDDPKPSETVWVFDMNVSSVHDININEDVDVDIDPNDCFVSDKIWNDKLYFGYYIESKQEDSVATGNNFEIKCLDLKLNKKTTFLQTKLPFNLTDLHVTHDSNIIASSSDSTIWLYDGQWHALFATEGLDAIANISIGGDGTTYVYVVGADGGRIYQKQPDSETFSASAAPLDVMNITFHDSKTWVATKFEHNTHAHSFQVSANGKIEPLAKLTVPIHLTLRGPVLLWIALEILLAAYIVLIVRHIYLRKKTRLIIKQVLIAIPIFAMGLLLLHNIISNRITDEMYNITYNELMLQAFEIEQYINKENFSNIDWSNTSEDDYYQELRSLLKQYSHSTTISWYDSNSSTPLKTNDTEYYSSYWIFRVDEDRAYTALCDTLYTNLESHYIDKDQRYKMIDFMLSHKKATLGQTYGTESGGYWFNVLYPISQKGKLIGFLEVGKPSAFVDKAVDDIMKSIFLIVGIVLGVSLFAYISILGFSLRAMDKLKSGAQKIADGDYSTRVHVFATDETADIATAFNRMGESIEESYRHIEAVRDGYRYFVPEKMLTILGRNSIAEIAPGHYTHLRAGYLLLSTDSFDAYRDKAFFDALNRFYACVIPHVTDAGGVIERFNGRGLAAIFDSAPKTVLNSLIKMFAAIDQTSDTLRAESNANVECHVMLSLSDSLLGVVGNEKRLNMIAISRLTYESERIGKMCRRYGCRVILTQSVYDELGPSVATYRHRLLGYIYDAEQEVTAYDFYDAEAPDLMCGKDETRDTFERAVDLYYAGNYAAARRLFIEVIKQSPKDLAAREYLKESHTRMESGLPPQPLLEL